MARIEKRTTKAIALIFLVFAVTINASAKVFSLHPNDSMISLDFPEGYKVLSSNKNTYQLQNTILPVSLIIKIYDKGEYKNAEEALKDNLTRIKANMDLETFKWRRQDAAIAYFTNNLGQYCSGYGESIQLPCDEGIMVLIAYCDQSIFEKAYNLILSTLDAVCIDYGSYYEKGPVTQYAYPESKKEIDVKLNIDGKEISTRLKDNDKEASEYVIEREYNILTLYSSSPYLEEAWKRYYRMIYRDSFGRLERTAFDIYNNIAPACVDETDLAQKLLYWSQNFEYAREKNNSDFTSLPAILLGEGCDCDARSLLLAVLLKSMNMEVTIFISPQFSHAMAGFVSDHPGHTWTFDNQKYLMGETTKKGLTWGKVEADMDNQNLWFSVALP